MSRKWQQPRQVSAIYDNLYWLKKTSWISTEILNWIHSTSHFCNSRSNNIIAESRNGSNSFTKIHISGFNFSQVRHISVKNLQKKSTARNFETTINPRWKSHQNSCRMVKEFLKSAHPSRDIPAPPKIPLSSLISTTIDARRKISPLLLPQTHAIPYEFDYLNKI